MADQSADGVHVEPVGLALAAAGHVRIEQGLVVLALGEPFELALAHGPLHGGRGVLLGHEVVVLAEVLGELGQGRQGQVVADSLAGKWYKGMRTYMQGTPSRPMGWVSASVFSLAR